jgi:hypothetical protein
MLPLPKAVFGAAALLGTLLLAACMFAPGKFDAALDVRRDGRFSFSYVGEIHVLALSQLAKAGESAVFTPEPCTDEASGEVRPCEAAELAEQRENWDRERQEKAARDKREAQSMKLLMGDLDMSDPRAGEDLAMRLRRQAGWRRVDYRGDGRFEVDFRIDGTLGHDFAFPTVENFPLGNAFVQLTLRSDGSLRIDAPGFGPITGGDMLRGLAGSAGASPDGGIPQLPVTDGRFIVTTDAPILANNTDLGPREAATGQELEWSINQRTAAAPMALLRLGTR